MAVAPVNFFRWPCFMRLTFYLLFSGFCHNWKTTDNCFFKYHFDIFSISEWIENLLNIAVLISKCAFNSYCHTQIPDLRSHILVEDPEYEWWLAHQSYPLDQNPLRALVWEEGTNQEPVKFYKLHEMGWKTEHCIQPTAMKDLYFSYCLNYVIQVVASYPVPCMECRKETGEFGRFSNMCWISIFLTECMAGGCCWKLSGRSLPRIEQRWV